MQKNVKRFKFIASTIIIAICLNFITPMFTILAKAGSSSYEVEQMLKQIISEYGSENIIFEDGISMRVNESLNISNDGIAWVTKNENVIAIRNNSELIAVAGGTTFIVGQKQNKYHVKEVYVADERDMVQAYMAPSQRAGDQYVVYIDPGHGGKDPGASGNGIIEKDITLEIAQNLKGKLQAKGVQVLMSRESDVFVSLADISRGANAVNPDIFISVHINSAEPTSASGIETFYKKDIDKELARTIQNKLISYTGANDRGPKWADFHVIRETNMPAALVECGFLTNVEEANNMKNKEYQDKLANAMADGAMIYLGKNIELNPANRLVADRIFGKNRYETSYDVFDKGWESSENIVLASGLDYPDALSAAPLAEKYSAPILLSSKESLSSQPKLLEVIKRKGVKNVFIVGGEGVIPKVVEQELSQNGVSSKRLGGRNRYETSVEIAKQLDSDTREAVIVSGLTFADGLSISPIAASRNSPILLTEKNAIPQEVRDYMNDKGINKTFIIGSSGVISDGVQQSLPNTERLGGRDRYETNEKILNRFKDELNLSTVYIASGLDYPDALSVSALAGKNRNFVVLTHRYSAEPVVKSVIETIRPKATDVFVLGSNALIADSILYSLGINEIR
ncbi:hypothetical protein JCM1393_06230 [Clostridium carnis]